MGVVCLSSTMCMCVCVCVTVAWKQAEEAWKGKVAVIPLTIIADYTYLHHRGGRSAW